MTTPDPWASAPTAATEDPWGAAPPPESAPAAYGGQGPDGKFVITLKGGSGFDAPWFVAHLDSLADVETALNDPTLKRILDKLQVIAPIFSASSQSVGGASKSPERRPAPAAAQTPPANAPAAPGPDWTYRSGTVKSGARAGETWQGWMPPRGTDAKPLFFE